MNDVYFMCKNCKIFIDAGYRWAYWTLESTNIVKRNQRINVDLVLASDEYFNPTPIKATNNIQFIAEQGKNLKEFLKKHKAHDIIYAELEILFNKDREYLQWLNEIYNDAYLMPRYFYERMNITSWDEVIEYINKLQYQPFWYDDNESIAAAKNVFNKLTVS